jgi:hypothetical protein
MRRVSVALIAVAAVVAACTASASPSPSPIASPSSSLAVSPSPSPAPSPQPSTSLAPGQSPSQCPPVESEGPLTCDRLVHVEVFGLPGRDVVEFTFAPPTALAGPNEPRQHIEVATPPFTKDPSGLPLDVPGEASRSFSWQSEHPDRVST